MAYDAAKANEVNQLIEQGIDPSEAIQMAGIPADQLGNYDYDPTTSQLGQQYGPPTEESVFDPRQDVAESVFDPGATFNGPATQESVFDPRQDVAESVFDPGATFNGPAAEESVFDPRQDIGENVFDPAGAVPRADITDAAARINDPYYGLTPAQIQALGGADPTDPYIRARLGIPQLAGSTLNPGGFAAYRPTGVPLIDNAVSAISSFAASLSSFFGPPTKPTVTTQGTTTGAVTENVFNPNAISGPINQGDENVFDPRQDVGENVFDPGTTYSGPATEESVFDPRQDVGENVFNPNAISGPINQGDENVFDPRQDVGENVFDPGTTYNGPATEESVFDPRQDVGENVFDPDSAIPNSEIAETAAAINDPYYGLTAQQLQDLGGADPTDPYIRARLGIPQLPGSTLNPGGFATFAPTGVPLIDGAVSAISSFTSSLSNLFSPPTKPTVTQQGTTTGAAAPAGVDTKAAAADAAAVKEQNPELATAAKENLTNIQEANANVVAAEENIAINNQSIQANEQAQAQALEQQRQAQAIIDQNNAELADDNLPDDRRAELEANNAAQQASIAENAAIIDEAQNNIDASTANNEQQVDSILENQAVVAENAEAFQINNGDLDGPVDAAQDPEIAAADAAANAELVADPEATIPEDVDPADDPEIPEATLEPDPEATIPEDVDPDTDAELQEPPGTEEPFTDLAEDVEDPFEARRLELEQELDDPPPTLTAEDVGEEDPFEARRLELEQELDDPPPTLTAEDVGEEDPFEARRLELEQELNREELAASNFNPEPVDTNGDPGLSDEEILARRNAGGLSDEEIIARQQAAEQAAAKANAINQATLQSRYKQAGNSDWRVRLQLGPTSDYLYNVGGNNAQEAGILAPLRATNGVIFPYTPTVTTAYRANYEQYDLIHSNYRGIYYKNSRVDDISVRGMFTAQDTTEANYLLAVIHFFRSVTKMFYGQDTNRGVPPPLVFLNGFGNFQFSKHPCVVTSFNYTLPNDVDYIRATSLNNYGGDLFNRRQPIATAPGGVQFAGAIRLANALLPKNAQPKVPTQNTLSASVTNTDLATYVPTKMEIDISLIPVQTRDQVSNQFSLKEFANGNLIKKGFW
jgi:hypothetical protein